VLIPVESFAAVVKQSAVFSIPGESVLISSQCGVAASLLLLPSHQSRVPRSSVTAMLGCKQQGRQLEMLNHD
jgi:hypothetical protein